jgi:phage recombination protein Bet
VNEIVIAEPDTYTREQLDLIKRTFALDATDDEFALFISTARRLNLNVFAKQVHFVKRKGRAITQIAIDGFRVIAERTGVYEGQTAAQWCGDDGVWRDAWLSSDTPPAAARVGVYRRGWREPLYCVARWGAYVQRDRDGNINSMWNTMGDVMLAKCAEALALRKAFPQDLSGVYTNDEMGQADNEPLQATPATVTTSGRMSEALSKCALGDEEKARAAAQAEVARGLADALIADFKLTIAAAEEEEEERGDEDEPVSVLDAARDWISANAGAADKLGDVERKRIAKTLCAYVGSGAIEGMNADGFKDEWNAAINASRPKRR